MPEQVTYSGSYIARGRNDIPFYRQRALGEARVQNNFRVLPNLTLGSLRGRAKIMTGASGTITGVVTPPTKIPLVTVTASNKVISVKNGATGTTISLTEQAYYTYTELATELQVQLRTLTGHGTTTVTYSNSTHLFTITNNHATDTLIMRFGLATTTFDSLTYLGWKFSTSIAAAASDASDGAVDDEPPCLGHDQVIFNDANAEFSGSSGLVASGTEVTLGDGSTTIPVSGQKVTGTWNQNKWYGSNGNGNHNLTMRDRYIRRLPTADDIGLYQIPSDDPAGQVILRNFTTDSANFAIDGTSNWALLQLIEGKMALIDKTTIRLSRNDFATSQGSFDVEVYYYAREVNTLTLLETINSEDIVTDTVHGITPSDANITLTNRWVAYDSGDHFLALKYVPQSLIDDNECHIWGADTGSLTFKTDSNGEVQDETFNWYGEVWMVDMASSISDYDFKISFVNSDGYETELGGVNGGTGTLQSGNHALIDVAFDDNHKNYDYSAIRIYRTAAAGSIYYLWAEIPRESHKRFYDLGGATTQLMTFRLAGEDSWLITQPEANVTTARTTKLNYKFSFWFDNLLWAGGDPDNPHLIFKCGVDNSGYAVPESWNLADDGIPIGDNQGDVIGGAPLAPGVAVVFKGNSFFRVERSGSLYGTRQLNQEGIGTLSHWSLVPVMAPDGNWIFFQGQDGHFYKTDGVRLVNLSGISFDARGQAMPGRLQVYVDALNHAKLDQTAAIYNTEHNEIVWSVCTGSNTTPDASVVYQVNNDSFYLDTYAADVWARSSVLGSITTGDPVTTVINRTGKDTLVGASSQAVWMRDVNIYEFNPSDSTENNVVAAEWQGADWPLKRRRVDKRVHWMEMVAEAEAATTAITFSWYADGKAAAASSAAHNVTTSPDEYYSYPNLECELMRAGIAVSGTTGPINISQITAESSPMPSHEHRRR